MNLSFMQQWPKGFHSIEGTETDFVSKIWKGLEIFNDLNYEEFYESKNEVIRDRLPNPSGIKFNYPKIHTVRADKSNRWKVGMKIHFAIGVRSPNYTQFAPILNVLHVQKIQLHNAFNDREIFIDGKKLTDEQKETFSANDGFVSESEFWRFFGQIDFNGKLIHWTNTKY